MRVHARTTRRTTVSGGLFFWLLTLGIAAIGYALAALLTVGTLAAALPMAALRTVRERNQRRRGVTSRAA